MLVTVYRVVLRNVATRGRVLGLLALGVVGVVVGISVGLASDVDRLEAGTGLANTFGMSLFVPVVTLVFSCASLGDLAEDGTLVYLWARPQPRWKLTLGAYSATLFHTLPLSVVPTVVGAMLLTGDAGTVVATGVATVAAA